MGRNDVNMTPVVHPARGFVVRVDGIFVADLLSSTPLLVHVRPPYQLSSETPAFSPRQLDVYTHVLIGFLQRQPAVLRFNTTPGFFIRLELNTTP